VDTHIACRRIYDEPVPSDGIRVRVDRVWPRGIRKEDARLDEWLRDVAPSTEFRRRYLAEQRNPRDGQPPSICARSPVHTT